jgi:hypothetical protein
MSKPNQETVMKWILAVAMAAVLCGCVMTDWWNDNKPDLPDIDIPSTTQPPAAGKVAPAGFVWGQWDWIPGSKSPSGNATENKTVKFKSVTVKNGALYFDYGGDYSWSFAGGDPFCDACWGMAYLKDGKWWAGYCDSFPRDRQKYQSGVITTRNLRDDVETGHKNPAVNTPWVLLLWSYDGSQYAWWPITWE